MTLLTLKYKHISPDRVQLSTNINTKQLHAISVHPLPGKPLAQPPLVEITALNLCGLVCINFLSFSLQNCSSSVKFHWDVN